MNIKYEPSRGTIAYDMQEVKEFKSIDDMKSFIVSTENGAFTLDDIVLAEISVSDKQQIYQVRTKRYGDADYVAKYGVPQEVGIAYCLLQKSGCMKIFIAESNDKDEDCMIDSIAMVAPDMSTAIEVANKEFEKSQIPFITVREINPEYYDNSKVILTKYRIL